MKKITIKNTELVNNLSAGSLSTRLSGILKKRVGPKSPKYTLNEVANATGIKHSTLASYYNGLRAITLPNLVKIGYVLDFPELMNAPFELVGYSGLHRVEGDHDHTPNTILSKMARRLAMLAEHLEDGHVDHREKKEQVCELRELAADLLEYTQKIDV